MAGLGTDLGTVKGGLSRARRWLADAGATRLLDDGRFDPLVATGSCQAALMFGCVAPDVRREDVLELARIMVARRTGEFDPPPSLAAGVAVAQADPWSQGYALAEDFIEQVGLSRCLATADFVDVERILTHLGVDTVPTSLTDENVRAVAIAGPRCRPCIALNESSYWNADVKGRRFSLAHELCHLLFDWEAGRTLAIASGPWAPANVEMRANAFAAMLLMPNAVVREAIARAVEPVETPDGIQEVANRLRTGFEATLRHVTNLGFIDEYDMHRIVAAADRRR